ncbi:MAG: biotin--[acetyl-CoA-carboxylase] ligase [Desulfocapsa sp.]|nr:MAG: biotin--[acetyl-CoA-carboxylase] ligase [Desulfocapsa sp.]
MENILHLASTVSTNEDAYIYATEGVEHGFAVLADTQTCGKGRLGRQWVTPAGTGLCCSVILRPQLPFVEFPRLTLTAGLALCKVVEKLTGMDSFGLKWPNDLYCEGKKCGGILVESSSPAVAGDESFVVVGIGLNVNSRLDDFPIDLQQTVTSLLIQTAKMYPVQEIFGLIRDSLLAHLRIHERDGFHTILQEWRNRDVLYGKEMQWLTAGKDVVTGVGLGPDDTGQLLVRDKEGKLYEVLSGDVELKE